MCLILLLKLFVIDFLSCIVRNFNLVDYSKNIFNCYADKNYFLSEQLFLSLRFHFRVAT